MGDRIVGWGLDDVAAREREREICGVVANRARRMVCV